MAPLELWSHPARAGRELSGFRTVEFPIHASPKSFTAYLQDMKTLCIRLYGITTSGGMCGDSVGLSEIDLQPWLRGPDVDYALRVEGFFPVVRSHSDRVMVGQLRVCLRTDWAEDAELRPKAEAIRSFEQHEWQARLTEERTRAVMPDVRHDAQKAEQVEPSVVGAHLQVHLCGLRLQRSALDSGSAGDLRVAFRFGPADEVSVAASLQEEDSDSFSYLLGSADVSSTPVWQLRDGRVDAPRLSSMHFHFWQGKLKAALRSFGTAFAGHRPTFGGVPGARLPAVPRRGCPLGLLWPCHWAHEACSPCWASRRTEGPAALLSERACFKGRGKTVASVPRPS